MSSNRFQDEEKKISDYSNEVLVVCPSCSQKAICKLKQDLKKVELICSQCGYNKHSSTVTNIGGIQANTVMAAHEYFNVALWLQVPFKNDHFFAYNDAHLEYLERYIGATLREHKNRTGFTLLEKLPKFYHDAKNREPLLKLIQKLKQK